MAVADQSGSSSLTNASRSTSITLFDEYFQVLKPQDYQIEFFISRDPSLILPDFELHNVTGNDEIFHYHLVNFNHLVPRLIYSIHFEMFPVDTSLSYLLIYKFNAKKMFTRADSSDGWTVFCSSSKFLFHWIYSIDDYVCFLLLVIRSNSSINYQPISEKFFWCCGVRHSST